MYYGELYHHGIKGMKWGVRRFEDESGKLTPAGKKRYGEMKVKRKSNPEPTAKKKSNRQLALENRYIKDGMSREDAEAVAAKRAKAEKFVAIAGVTTVAALTAYGVYKHRKYTKDVILDMDDRLQTMMSLTEGSKVENPNAARASYATFKKGDKKTYENLFGDMLDLRPGETTKVEWAPNSKIKIASHKSAKEVFDELYKSDSSFKSLVDRNADIQSRHWGSRKLNRMYERAIKSSAKNSAGSAKISKSVYDAFNISLVNESASYKKEAVEKFYNALKDKGFQGVQDINDQKYSNVIRSKMPVILFDGVSKVKEHQYSLEELERIRAAAAKHEKLREMSKNSMMALAMYGGPTATMIGGANLIAIKQYKKQHPNTKLSDREILKTLRVERKR